MIIASSRKGRDSTSNTHQIARGIEASDGYGEPDAQLVGGPIDSVAVEVIEYSTAKVEGDDCFSLMIDGLVRSGAAQRMDGRKESHRRVPASGRPGIN